MADRDSGTADSLYISIRLTGQYADYLRRRAEHNRARRGGKRAEPGLVARALLREQIEMHLQAEYEAKRRVEEMAGAVGGEGQS